MQSYSGWFGFVMSASGYIKMFAFVLIGYLLVVVLDFKRIKKIPMDEALCLLIIAVGLAVTPTIRQFKGHGGCCGGGSYKPKSWL